MAQSTDSESNALIHQSVANTDVDDSWCPLLRKNPRRTLDGEEMHVHPQGCFSSIPKRYLFVLFIILSNTICYADRTNISISILKIAEDQKWESKDTNGDVLAAFFYGYLITQIPGGWAAGKVGGKAVLLFGVITWSLFTILTPPASPIVGVLIAVRILMGIGEGVNFPSLHNLVSHWIPVYERSKAVAFMTSGQEIGTVTALLGCPHMIDTIGWEWTFYIFGIFGVVWAFFFWLFATTKPEDMKSISNEELQLIKETRPKVAVDVSPIPWKEFFESSAVWGIIIAHFCNNWGWYVILSWLPEYYKSNFKVEIKNLGVPSVLPYISMFIMSNVGGLFADWLIKKGVSIGAVRKVVNTIGFIGPAVFFLLLRFGLGLNGFARSGYWVNHLDISPRYASHLLGITNCIATLPGIIGNHLTGWIIDAFDDWNVVFYIATGVYVTGAAFFVILAKGHHIFE